MTIDIPIYLKGEDLGEISKERPLRYIVRGVLVRAKEELPFESEVDRYEVTVENEKGQSVITANSTSLRYCIMKWGRDEQAWIDKTIILWTVKQNVMGKMKDVVYFAPAPEKKE